MNNSFEFADNEIEYKFRRCADKEIYDQDRNAGTKSPKPSTNKPFRNPRSKIDILTDKIEPLGTSSRDFKQRFLKTYFWSVTTKMSEDYASVVYDHNMDKLQLCAEQTIEQQTIIDQ